MNDKYEYLLHYWGEINNFDYIEKELGITENYFWFDLKEERKEFKNKLKSIAGKHNVCIVFSEEEGKLVRYKTKANIIFELNGKEYDLEYDFGYGYPEESALYMFEDGNYSCDCNKAMFLSGKYPELEKELDDMKCGDTIKIKKIKINFAKK